jgi:diaminohydroxyphosphoribosylaminopyrimidine deaminase / 5-amino-6-(5-phosphoribosylamino)uracil reductase
MDYTKLPHELHELFTPLTGDKSFVVGQLGQSLDGRVATPTGHSKYINRDDGLLHLHRLRAVVDAVVVGVGTVIADNPLLNTRLCAGQNPARVIIDPQGRLPDDAATLRDDGTRCIVMSINSKLKFASHIEHIVLPHDDTKIAPHAIIEELAKLGLHKILVEGGPRTLTNFITHKALDRLHLIVAPIILGSGKSGLSLPPIEMLDEALRPKTKSYKIGDEVIFDCEFQSLKD